MDDLEQLAMVVPPASPAVALDLVKAHLRVQIPDDDALILGQIATATDVIEGELRRALVSRTYLLQRDGFPRSPYRPSTAELERSGDSIGQVVRLPKPPLAGVISIAYVDPQGIPRTLDPSDYVASPPGSVLQGVVTPAYGTRWPQVRPQLGAVSYLYQAGYGGQGSIPPGIVSAILLLVGTYYDNRSEDVAGAMSKLPSGVMRCINPYRWGFYG